MTSQCALNNFCCIRWCVHPVGTPSRLSHNLCFACKGRVVCGPILHSIPLQVRESMANIVNSINEVYSKQIMSIVNNNLPPPKENLIAQKKGSLHKSFVFKIDDSYVMKLSWPLREEAMSLLVDEPILMQRMPSHFTPAIHWWGVREVMGKLGVVIIMDYIVGDTLANIFSSCKEASCLMKIGPELSFIKESLLRLGFELRRLQIYHRDIRPENIIYSFGMRKCYLIDYALSSSVWDKSKKIYKRRFCTFDGLNFDINNDDEAFSSLFRTIKHLNAIYCGSKHDY